MKTFYHNIKGGKFMYQVKTLNKISPVRKFDTSVLKKSLQAL